MKLKTAFTSAALASAMVAVSTPTLARDTVNIVGSSTVYPFATVVAEKFGNDTDFPTPKLESTGSGGGLKLFCEGIGTEHPDITNASRRIKASEIDNCAANGVENVTEVRIGSDGIVLAYSVDAEPLDLSLEQLFLALAKEVPDPDGGDSLVANPYENWSDIDSDLPDVEISVMGPPPTSGTRDAFVEIAMQGGCEEFDMIASMDEDKMESVCHSLREDGAFIEAGENDNLIVQRLDRDPDTYGIFGYSFFIENEDKLDAAEINGVAPTIDTIGDDSYPVSRSMYFYIKNDHVGVVPGIMEYVQEFTSEDAFGEGGYLAEVGLIPSPEKAREKARDDVENQRRLSKEDLM